MKKNTSWKRLSWIAAGLALSGCGKSTSGTTLATTLSSLPDATSGVNSSGLVVRSDGMAAGVAVGQAIGSAGSANWSTKSRAACEMGRLYKDMVREVGQADRMKCFLGAMDSAGLITDTYNGADHYLVISGGTKPDGTAAGGKVKFNVAKDSDGAITSFQMYSCFQSATAQDNFVNIGCASGTCSVTAAGAHTFGGTADVPANSGSHRTTVTGTFANGVWTAGKSFEHHGVFTGTAMIPSSNGTPTPGATPSPVPINMGQYLKATEDGSAFTVDGWRQGTMGSKTQLHRMSSMVAIVNASTPDEIKIGEGSMKWVFDYGGGASNQATVSWKDDLSVLDPATGGTYYSTVDAKTLITVESSVMGAEYLTAEKWDCTVPSGTTAVTIKISDMPKADLEKCQKRDLGNDATREPPCEGAKPN